jgi:type VI secretion system protein ImpL
VFDRNIKAARGTLQEDRRFGESAKAALTFLDEMERLRPFVVPPPDGEKNPPFTLDFTPHFRVNQGNEQGGNQIIDWTMQVAGQIFRQHDPDHPGRWRPGNNVRLSLRWANDSMFLPMPDNAQPDLRLRDRNAYFELNDHWALLEFLRRHQAPPSEIRQADATAYTLKFSMKMMQDPKWVRQADDPAPGTTLVYMSMRVSMAGGKTPVFLPAFPATAPRLTQPGATEGAR